MGNFKNTLLSLIDNGSMQARNIFKNFSDVVNSFDMNAQIDYFNEKKNELIKRGNELFEDFTSLLKEVRENISDFSVTVPFNEGIGEKINYEVNNGRLSIEVTYEDETSTRSNKTSVLIPNNCDLDNVSLTVDANAKTATVTIPKIVEEPRETPHTEETTTTTTTTTTNKPKKNKVRKKKVQPTNEENTPSNDEASMTHISSRLANRLRENEAKYNSILTRDSRGRFVRRNPRNAN